MINEIYLQEGREIFTSSEFARDTSNVDCEHPTVSHARARKIDDMQNWFLYGEQDYTAIQTRF